MSALYNKRILLGVSGGIAAYKSAELVRRLREQGAEVQVVMTRAACEFITPLTMQALSGRPVFSELLDHDSEAGMGHIELARWSDIILVAPASANFLARLAHGMADDLLSTLCLAADSPLLVAPAMNQRMWLNQATSDNLDTLRTRGISILGPAEGDQACGENGPGRLLEPAQLLAALESVFATGSLSGLRITITAGPTREAIDPVRFISNRSSGKMGFAIARAALEAGARVTLISGPVALEPPVGADYVAVSTARQMYDVALEHAAQSNIFVAAAAVADYRCADIADQKIKKQQELLSLDLVRNPDILAAVAALRPAPFTVGFAAETQALADNALKKLDDKGLDMIAANLVGEGLGFDSDENALELFWRDGQVALGRTSKDRLARRLLETVAGLYHDRRPADASPAPGRITNLNQVNRN